MEFPRIFAMVILAFTNERKLIRLGSCEDSNEYCFPTSKGSYLCNLRKH